MNSVIYARISSTNQTEGVGLESQVAFLKQAASNKNLKVNSIVTEVGSARTPEKLVKLNKLINELPGNSFILVHSYDRFSRNVIFALTKIEELRKRNIFVVSLSEPLMEYQSPANYKTLVDVFNNAQMDSSIKSAKVKNALAYKRQIGGFTRKAPYGFSLVSDLEYKVKRLVTEEKEFEVRNFILDLHNRSKSDNTLKTMLSKLTNDTTPLEFLSKEKVEYEDVSKILNGYSITYRNNKKWDTEKVKRVCEFIPEKVYNESEILLNNQRFSVKDQAEPEVENVRFHEDEEMKY